MDPIYEHIYMNTKDSKISDSNSEGCGETLNKPAAEAVTGSGDGRLGFRHLSKLCLGLLCAVLLGVLIGLCIRYNAERDELQSSYYNLSVERDELQSNYYNLSMERDQLQSDYSDLSKKWDQLQNHYYTLYKERDQLQSGYNNMTLERNGLLIKLSGVCPDGWKRFKSKCYYTSSHSLSWDRSRADCLQRDADLVIINSREEQDFVSGLGYGDYWIGLTDSAREGTWKWVDGTTLAQGFWYSGEPNNGGRYFNRGYRIEEDCVQLTVLSSFGRSSNWGDTNCNNQLLWICEKHTQCPLD